MALSADARRSVRNLQGKKVENYTVATGSVIYHGALCCVDKTTQRLKAATITSTNRFVGVAEESGTGNTAGTVTVDVAYGHEALITGSGLTAAYVGCNAAVADDNKVCSASAAGTTAKQLLVGEIISIPTANNIWVFIRNQVHRNV